MAKEKAILPDTKTIYDYASCRDYVVKICENWDKESMGLLSPTIVRSYMKKHAKFVGKVVNIRITSIANYMRENGFESATYQEVITDRAKKNTLKKAKDIIIDGEKEYEQLEKVANELAEKLKDGKMEVDDVIVDALSKFHTYALKHLEMAIRETNVAQIDKALKNINNLVSSAINSRIINNKPTAALELTDGMRQMLDKYFTPSTSNRIEGYINEEN